MDTISLESMDPARKPPKNKSELGPGLEELTGTDKFSDINLAFAIIDCLPCLPILLLNLAVVKHYQNEYKKFVPCMYLLMSFCDGFMGVFVLLRSSILIHYYLTDTAVDILDSGATHVLVTSSVLVQVLYRISIFINVLLCVARTIKIKLPFYQITMKLALLSVAAYILVWLAVAGYDYQQVTKSEGAGVRKYIVSGRLGAIIGRALLDTYDKANLEKGIKSYYGITALFIIILIPFIIPCICCIVCLIILAKSLKKSPSLSKNSSSNQKHVTITVTWLTSLFVVCNSLSTIYFLFADYIAGSVLGKDMGSIDDFIDPLLTLTFPLLNAAISPFIIVFRSRELKDGLRKTLTVKKQSVGKIGDGSVAVRSSVVAQGRKKIGEDQEIQIVETDLNADQ